MRDGNKFERFLKDLDKNEIYGGGGTDVNNVLRRLSSENPRQQYDCIVVLTDCYDSVPEQKYVQILLNGKSNVLIISTSTESSVDKYVRECRNLGYGWSYLEIED